MAWEWLLQLLDWIGGLDWWAVVVVVVVVFLHKNKQANKHFMLPNKNCLPVGLQGELHENMTFFSG